MGVPELLLRRVLCKCARGHRAAQSDVAHDRPPTADTARNYHLLFSGGKLVVWIMGDEMAAHRTKNVWLDDMKS